MTTKENACYAAGLFDGEGYVGIDKTSVSSGKARSVHRGVRVIISQKDGRIMNWLKDNFGGNVYSQRNGTKYSIYRWRTHAEKADKFLRCIQPYVIIKKPQVDFALDFNDERKKRTIIQGRSIKSGKYLPMTEDEIAWRLQKRDELVALKRDYVPYIKDIVNKD